MMIPMNSGGGGGAFEGALLHVRDEKAAGSYGGSSSASTWHTRTLNTVLVNEISGAALASNQVTLPGGDYYVEACAPSLGGNGHTARLYNVTDGAVLLEGGNAYNDGSLTDSGQARVSGRFGLAGEKVIELRHFTINAHATNGLGQRMNAGLVEVFSDLKIWKVG